MNRIRWDLQSPKIKNINIKNKNKNNFGYVVICYLSLLYYDGILCYTLKYVFEPGHMLIPNLFTICILASSIK
jgi:hypothetical protein